MNFFTCKYCGKSKYRERKDLFPHLYLCNTCYLKIQGLLISDTDLYKKCFNEDKVPKFFNLGVCTKCNIPSKVDLYCMAIHICDNCIEKWIIPKLTLIKCWKKLKNL